MLRHFLDDFMSFVPLQMPQLLNVATMEEPQFYGDYVLLTLDVYKRQPLSTVSRHTMKKTVYTFFIFPLLPHLRMSLQA